MRNKKILIMGYYGAKNTGDEVLLKSVIELLKLSYDSPNISAITYNVKDTAARHGIKAVSRNKFTDILKSIRQADMVIGGGGSMIQNVTSNRSLFYYLFILHISKKMGKKVVLMGNGIGPIFGDFSRNMTIKVLKDLDAITLRDRDSFDTLKSWGIENIHLSSDLAFNLSEFRGIEFDRKPKKVSINLRNWNHNKTMIGEIRKFIQHLLERGFIISIVPFQEKNDDKIMKKIVEGIEHENLSILRQIEYKNIIQEIGTSDILIGMRLHSLIFSSISKTPFIALSYDPKVTSFSKSQGQEYIEDICNLNFEDLKDLFDKVYSNIGKYRERIDESLKESNKLSERNRDILYSKREKKDG